MKREKKNIPNLIYWVEEYEKQLIQLGKKSKVSERHIVTFPSLSLLLLQYKFMDSYKRSVARDFKIKESTLNALIQEQVLSLLAGKECYYIVLLGRGRYRGGRGWRRRAG